MKRVAVINSDEKGLYHIVFDDETIILRDTQIIALVDLIKFYADNAEDIKQKLKLYDIDDLK